MPFVIHVLSDDAESARHVADALAPQLAARQASARVETGTRPMKGTVASVGVIGADGAPRWLAPLAADGKPDEAALGVLRFLERWGFVKSGATSAS